MLYNVFCYNTQDEATIDYGTGESSSSNVEEVETTPPPTVIPPKEDTAEVENIADVDANGNRTVTIAEAKAAGYKMPITSDHWLYKYMRDADGDGMVGESN